VAQPKLFRQKSHLLMLRAQGKFWQRHHETISRDDFSEAPNEVYHHAKQFVAHAIVSLCQQHLSEI
jgi:hypothetical protein